MNVGFTAMNMKNETAISKYCRCPICDSPVTPISAGFANCEWMWEGTIEGNPTRSTWKHVGDEYARFESNESAMVDYQTLIITARESIGKRVTK